MDAKTRIKILIAILILLISLSASPGRAASTWYVKVGGTGDCTSWLAACDLQVALGKAGNGDEVWVASGTYYPGDAREDTFLLENGVEIYGGFPSGGGTWEERDWQVNTTTLSGEIGDPEVDTDDIYRVVSSSNVTVIATLDGFIISNAFNDRSGPPYEWGGGMYILDSSVSLSHLRIEDNYSKAGAGIFINGGPTFLQTLDNIESLNNYAVINGGGLHVHNGSIASLTHAIFMNNTAATGSGGGIFTADSDLTINQSSFSDNNANIGGGAIASVGLHGFNILNSTFTGNTTGISGGALYPGAVYDIVSGCTFTNNFAWQNGGAIHSNSNTMMVTNSTFVNNSAWADGGAVDNRLGAMKITNSTFSGNLSNGLADSLLNQSWTWGITFAITNTIISAPTTDNCYGDFIDGGGNLDWPQGSSCPGIEVDPQLGLLADNGGDTQTMALLTGSPAIDTGGSASCPATDQRGTPRPIDGNGDGTARCDIGAYEYMPLILMVVQDGLTSGECLSWGTACNLQYALGRANAGDQVWVAAGTYYPGEAREDTFLLEDGVRIYGGFPSEGGTWEQRDWQTNPTTLSGEIGATGVYTDNIYRVVSSLNVTINATLDGFTISGANNNRSGTPDEWGGGMYIDKSNVRLHDLSIQDNFAVAGAGMFIDSYTSDYQVVDHVAFTNNHAAINGGGLHLLQEFSIFTFSSLTLTDVAFTNNSAGQRGGGMHNMNSYNNNLTLSDVAFSNNSANEGGGMFNDQGNPSLTNVTFSGNSADIIGGGMGNFLSYPTLTNVTFSANSANYDGGGMFNMDSSPTLTNVTFSANIGNGVGGGMANMMLSNPTLTNVTFSGNSANGAGGGMYTDIMIPTLTNAILWGNTPDQIFGPAIVTYSDIQGGWTGPGSNNINLDPLLGPLADNGGDTLTHALLPGSPAIDAGSPEICPATDQRGMPRPFDGNGDGTPTCDMGAYEYVKYSVFLPIVQR